METLKLNYGQISQIATYFKSLENANDLTFSQKRRLMRLNEELEKEFTFLNVEIQTIVDANCDRDENGDFIFLENNGRRIKDESIDIVNKAVNEIFQTEVELSFQPFKLPEHYFNNLKCAPSTIKLIEENFLENE